MSPDRPAAQGTSGAPVAQPGPTPHRDGTKVLVLGILGRALCQVLAPFAWVMGNRAVEQIDASPGSFSNRSTVNAGRISGIVGSVLLIAVTGVLAVTPSSPAGERAT